LSLFRDFSAPVKVEFDQSREELLFLLQHDSDGFNRWDAGQRLMLHWINDAMAGQFSLNQDAEAALKSLLADESLDPAMVAYLLTLPTEAYVAEFSEVIDPLAIHNARKMVREALATALEKEFAATWQRLNSTQSYAPEPVQMSARALKNLALSYWTVASAAGSAVAQQQYDTADNMTDQMAALVAIINSDDSSLATEYLQRFYDQWQGDVLVVNQWLSVQAGSAQLGSVDFVSRLLQHEAFDWRNPNKVRSVIGAFASQALCHFHAEDGRGYQLLADAVIKLNASNPQIAARLLAPLTKWKRLVPAAGQKMKAQLERIMSQDGLSKDVYEVVSKSLV